ncbi:thiamine phosphate synthase [Anaerovibrio sp.]|uniref:thiamine phosphate synthase n=1 Tax=Anaerovibrio sp. TaxID=1872532 RepID=UPI0025D54493|nr:thiamine phosphate synthase [Anaerovibrio sp.]
MTRSETMELFKTFPIYGITAEKASLGRNNYEVVHAMLRAGIRFIQYREKEKAGLDRYEECVKLRGLTREYGAAFIIDDFVDLALAVDADGVHIGQEDLPPAVVRKLVGENMVIGLSTHSPEQLDRANSLKGVIDYVGVGPVFPTMTKASAVPVGFSYVEYAANSSELPFVAIGGIKEENISEVWEHGARNIAVVTDITQSENIEQKIQNLTNNIRK